ncbi:MAG: hypothetical protein ACOH2F_20590 [Cellulomonas sp.]
MSNEPGERRRRRELERASEHAAQQAADESAGAAAAPPVTLAPLAPVHSRRELRELERARAAQELAAATPVDAPSRPALPTVAQQQPPVEPRIPAPPVPVASAVPAGPAVPKKLAPEPAVLQPAVRKAAVAPPAAARRAAVPNQAVPKHDLPGPASPSTASPSTAQATDGVSAPGGVRSYSKEAGPVTGHAMADSTSPEQPAIRRSRRSMRPQPVPDETARTPVVNPPATTGTIRMVVPEATANDRPARSEGSSTPSRGYPPVAPRRSALSPLVTSAGGGPVPPTASPSATPPSATPPSASPTSAGGGDFAWTTAAPPVSERTSAADRPAVRDLTPAPDQPAVPDQRDDDRLSAEAILAAQPDRTPARPARPGGAPLAPRWGHVPSGSFDAITRPPDDEEDSSAPVRLTAEAKEAGPVRRSTAYTVVQWLALVVLAFVLGFLVWLLIKGSNEPGAAGASAPAPTTSSSGTSWPHLGDL